MAQCREAAAHEDGCRHTQCRDNQRNYQAQLDKVAHYLGMKVIRIMPKEDFCADVSAMASAVNDNTILLAGSAPQFSQGVIDPIQELGRLAESHDLWLHVDGCKGGIMAPFVRKLGYSVPDYDFRVPGVSSISADLHKYGFSPKGVSVILYRDVDLQKYQEFCLGG